MGVLHDGTQLRVMRLKEVKRGGLLLLENVENKELIELKRFLWMSACVGRHLLVLRQRRLHQLLQRKQEKESGRR